MRSPRGTRANILKGSRTLCKRFCRFLRSEGDPKSRRSHPTRAPLATSRNLGQRLASGEFQIPERRSHFCLSKHARFKNSIRPRRSPFCPSRILRSRKDAEQIPDQEKSAKRDSCVSADICGRWRPGRNLDGQIPKGRCRILSLWDIVQNSIGTTRKPRGRSHSKKCYHHS